MKKDNEKKKHIYTTITVKKKKGKRLKLKQTKILYYNDGVKKARR